MEEKLSTLEANAEVAFRDAERELRNAERVVEVRRTEAKKLRRERDATAKACVDIGM